MLTERQERARALVSAQGPCRIKLCGLRTPGDVAAANAAAPDLVGFVTGFPRSRRSVGTPELERLSALVSEDVTRVLVTVDMPVASLAELFCAGLADALQLHGNEDEAYVGRLRELTGGAAIIQAFRVTGNEDVEAARRSTADLVLVDSGQGTGEAFDWSLVSSLERPFVLAGGLGPGNVMQAMAATHPWGVDMSSGIETDGSKDPQKMLAAVSAVRGEDR